MGEGLDGGDAAAAVVGDVLVCGGSARDQRRFGAKTLLHFSAGEQRRPSSGPRIVVRVWAVIGKMLPGTFAQWSPPRDTRAFDQALNCPNRAWPRPTLSL